MSVQGLDTQLGDMQRLREQSFIRGSPFQAVPCLSHRPAPAVPQSRNSGHNPLERLLLVVLRPPTCPSLTVSVEHPGTNETTRSTILQVEEHVLL